MARGRTEGESMRRVVGGVVIAGLCALAMAGCAGTTGTQPADSTTAEKPTMEEWGLRYPLQYASYAVHDQKTDDQYHSHYDLKTKLLAPAVRMERNDGQLDTKLLAVQPEAVDAQGLEVCGDALYNSDGYLLVEGVAYDPQTGRWYIEPQTLGDLAGTRERWGCFSCKSSRFNDVYAEQGAEVLGQPMTAAFIEAMNGQVWDCGTCHGVKRNEQGQWQLDLQADSQLFFWKQLARDAYDRLDPAERVCGQCHNSLDHRSYCSSQEVMDSFAPYRYGLSIDALYDAAIDDGIYRIDEATGAKITCLDHPEVEITQGSVMRELGVTCVDCHMSALRDGPDGEVYTSHNASGSPLDSEEALTYCLTCHASQGIESAEAMAKMVRDLQAQTTEIATELQGLLGRAYEQLAEAVERGSLDEAVIQRCRDDYSRAEAYIHATVGTVASEPLGTKVVHNPAAIASYNARARALLVGILAVLDGKA